MSGKLCSNWDTLLTLFSVGTDTYFCESYHRLNADAREGDEICCFHYESRGDHYLLPFIKRPIANQTPFFDGRSAYGYGGPLTTTTSQSFIREACQQLLAVCGENGIVTLFVRFHPLAGNHRHFPDDEKFGLVYDRKTVVVSLSETPEQIWQLQVHPKHRNVIRRARENGLRVEFDAQMAKLEVFISMYDATMDRLKARSEYYFSRDYFELLRNLFRNQSCLCTVVRDEQVLSACILFWGGQWGHYHLSCSDASSLGLYPNNLMVYEAGLYLRELGIEKFHLGGGISTDTEDSLFKFKSRFSSRTADFWLGKIVPLPSVYAKICTEWRDKFPERVGTFGHLLQCYRY